MYAPGAALSGCRCGRPGQSCRMFYWEEGRDINTTNSLIRYLGIFLGTPEGVARKWEETVTAKMRKRYERWLARGIPRSRRGRNIVIRNHVQACAWYLVQAQTPPNLPQMLDQWQQYAWRFFEAPANAEGLQQARRHAVKRGTLIQEYPEGGQRCQDVEVFTRSLYQRQVGRLIAPSTHKGVNLVMTCIHEGYGHLRMRGGVYSTHWSA